jgi:hypothetical protein
MGPYVLCIDVGGPTKIGWADGDGRHGSGLQLGSALAHAGGLLHQGRPVALGFEAPIWTPRRDELSRITSSRGGAELALRRAWSASAGMCALGAALALMPWCLARLREAAPSVTATTDFDRFAARGGLLIWEAFISGPGKGTSHHDDATIAVSAFTARFPNIISDVPAEPAVNHAAVALTIAGFTIDADEIGRAGLVVAANPHVERISA